MDNENNNIQDWYYAGEADIVIGETPISNTAKIVLIILCVLLVAVIGTTIYFRHYIVDYIANPTVQLSTNEITLNVYDEFNPENYIANKEKISNVEYNVNNTVNTSTLGDYTVTYESKNRARTNTANLLVHVVDKIAPSIQLVNNGSVILVDNPDEINKFDPMNYILEVSDNYDKKVKLDYNTPTKETFSNAAQSKKAVAIDYVATDSSGNIAQVTLTVFVQPDYESKINNSEASQEEIEKLQKQLEEQQRQLEEQQKQIDEQKKELEEKQNPTPTPSADPGKTTPTPTEPKQTGTSEPKQTSTSEPKQTQTNRPSNKTTLKVSASTSSSTGMDVSNQIREKLLANGVDQKHVGGGNIMSYIAPSALTTTATDGYNILIPGTYTIDYWEEYYNIIVVLTITE